MAEIINTFPFFTTFIAGFLAFVLGLIWYHPKMLGEKWLAARGKSTSDTKPYAPLQFFVSLLLWLMAAVFYTFLVDFHGVDNPAALICLSSLLWVAFAMPPTVMGAFYTGYPFQAVSIDSAYQLAGYYVLAAVHIVAGLML